MAKWTGSKPGGPQQEHLIPLTERSEEEAFNIRSKGGKASQKKQQESRRLSQIVRCVLAMGYNAGKVADPEKLYTMADAENANVPIQTLIVMREVNKYFETGDIESRNWLFKHAFPDGEEGLMNPSGGGMAGGSGSAQQEQTDGVRIHLIRGEKPKPPESGETKATPDGGSGEPHD